MCSRPFGSVSCTRSPARNGPDPGAAFTPVIRHRVVAQRRQGCGKVGGGQDAGRRAVLVHDEVLHAGVARTAASRSSPSSPRGSTSPASSGRRHRAERHPRSPLGGNRVDPRLVDDRGGTVAGVDEHEPARAALPHPAQRLGDRQVRRHEQPGPQQRLEFDARHRGHDLGELQRLPGAEPQVDREHAPRKPETRPPALRLPITLSASTPTASRGRPTRRRRCRSGGTSTIAQTTARSNRPPSSGRPGSRLKRPRRGCSRTAAAASTPQHRVRIGAAV